jgi:hypothetical protein
MHNPWAALAAACALVCAGCPFYPSYEIAYDQGTVPGMAANFHEINTRWDDMNLAGPPTIHNDFVLFCSTNRGSRGSNFDIHWFWVGVAFDQTDGTFSLYANEGRGCARAINSDADEFGPLLLEAQSDDPGASGARPEQQRNQTPASLLLFSSDRTPNRGHDIFFTHAGADPFAPDSADSAIAVSPAAAINSDSHDAYPAIGPDSCLYFCSDRDGGFDIYRAALTGNPRANIDSLRTWLSDSAAFVQIDKVASLSSEEDDKCPFILGATMVLASDRPGGAGGFDIWKSEYRNGRWSAPERLDAAINTQADEYRPILMELADFSNRLLLFSSNRDGGHGGYDIYYAGFPAE